MRRRDNPQGRYGKHHNRIPMLDLSQEYQRNRKKQDRNRFFTQEVQHSHYFLPECYLSSVSSGILFGIDLPISSPLPFTSISYCCANNGWGVVSGTRARKASGSTSISTAPSSSIASPSNYT